MGNLLRHIPLFSILLFSATAIAGPQPKPIDPTAGCIATFNSKPELRILQGKIELTDTGSLQSLEMMASNR
ncbi:MAG TPA: hypothetical protein VMV33_14885, partial [Rhodocyclaceae bacterium]|nr:hypothetical protein [Rhodocyclaceae bacterium]